MPARVPHQALRLARQHGVAAQTEDEIGIAIGHDQRHQLGIGEMPVAAQHDMGMRPMMPQQAQHALHDHGVLGPGRSLARAQHGSHQRAGAGLEHQQGQVAIVAVMVVVKRQRLLAISGVVGVVEIEGDGGRGARVTGDELLDQRAGHAVNIAAAQRSFQAGVGRAAGQQIAGIQRRPSGGQFEQRVAAQGVGVVAVLIT